MMMRILCVWVCGLVFFAGGGGVMAEELPDGMLEKMSSDQFEIRANAYRKLEKWSVNNLKTSPESLHKAWVNSQDPEVKTRCYVLMKKCVIQLNFGRGRGFVGIMMDPVILGALPQGKQAQVGISIVQVLPNTPAEKAKLKPGDKILGIDDLDFNNLPENQKKSDVRSLFQDYVSGKHPDDAITLHLLREGKKRDQKVVLMKRPASADPRLFGREHEYKKSESEAFFEGWLKKAAKK